LNADGLADNAFGNNGRVVTEVSATNWDEAHAVAVQADGRIVVGGWSMPATARAATTSWPDTTPTARSTPASATPA